MDVVRLAEGKGRREALGTVEGGVCVGKYQNMRLCSPRSTGSVLGPQIYVLWGVHWCGKPVEPYGEVCGVLSVGGGS